MGSTEALVRVIKLSVVGGGISGLGSMVVAAGLDICVADCGCVLHQTAKNIPPLLLKAAAQHLQQQWRVFPAHQLRRPRYVIQI